MQLTDIQPRTVLCLLSSCCTSELVKMHVSLAGLLRTEGVRFVVLVTDGECCTYFETLVNGSSEKCTQERNGAFELLGNAGVEVRRLSDFRDVDHSTETIIPVDELAADSDPRHSELWPTVRASVVRHCGWMASPPHDAPLTVADANTARRYLASARRYIAAFRDAMTAYRPSHVLVFNGLFYQERIASEAAFRVGARVFVTESSSFWNRRVFGEVFQNRGVRESLRLNVPERFSLSVRKRQRLIGFLEKVYRGKNNWTRQRKANAQETELQFPEAEGKRVALFLSQVPYDSVITEDAMLVDLPSVLDQVISVFERLPDWHLVIRLHPVARDRGEHLDPLAAWLRAHPARNRFTLVHGLEASTYALMDQATMGITVSSQSGLEMLGKHRTVVVLGSAFYRDNGVTIDRNPGESIRRAIERGIAHVFSEKDGARADRVLYYWIFRYLTAFSRRRGAFLPKGRKRLRELLRERPDVVTAGKV